MVNNLFIIINQFYVIVSNLYTIINNLFTKQKLKSIVILYKTREKNSIFIITYHYIDDIISA